ncbi:MAG: polysaccharide lyase family 1 protein [Chloroflexi bacterium]|nr:polysaccharide lyase family 1 protein [Chloroflexota bacterium]
MIPIRDRCADPIPPEPRPRIGRLAWLLVPVMAISGCRLPGSQALVPARSDRPVIAPASSPDAHAASVLTQDPPGTGSEGAPSADSGTDAQARGAAAAAAPAAARPFARRRYLPRVDGAAAMRVEPAMPSDPAAEPAPAQDLLAASDEASRRQLLAGAEGYGAGATGGLAGPRVVVTSLADAGPGSLREALETPGPAWVVFGVDGQIQLRHPIVLQSDKTVDGRGRRIELVWHGLDINGVRNVVVSNLALRDGKGDAVSVRHGARQVWLDHLSLSDFDDGLVDVTREASDVTVSWSRFENHVKGMLIGANDWDPSAAVIRVSLHHNWFHDVQRRLPKLRYGRAHAYNNLVERWHGPAVEVGFGGQIRLEGNVYLPDPDKSKAIVELDPDGAGTAGGGGNWTGGLPLTLEAVFVPEYPYRLETPSDALVDRLRTETGWQAGSAAGESD